MSKAMMAIGSIVLVCMIGACAIVNDADTSIHTVACTSDGIYYEVDYIGYADHDRQSSICECTTDMECMDATGINY